MRASADEARIRVKRRLLRPSIPNIIGAVLCVLLLPGFLIFMTLFISSLIHPGAPPSCFGFTTLMVESGSMFPFFDEDDLVLIQNGADGESYAVGDVVCFRSGDAYVSHRIVQASEENGETVYTTQGDVNNTPAKSPSGRSRFSAYTGRISRAWERRCCLSKRPSV